MRKTPEWRFSSRLHNRDGHSTVPWFEELREDPTLPADLLASGSSAPLAFPFQYVVLEQWLERSQFHERSDQRIVPGYRGDHRDGFAPSSLFSCVFVPHERTATPEGVFKIL